MEKIITESSNKNTEDIDIIPTFDIVRKINEEDKKVAAAIEKELENIARAVDIIADAFLEGGRLFYFGAGTSGRLGVLDASECPPTFGVEEDMVQGIIAGGDRALRYAIEGAEDSFESGQKDALVLNKKDVCTLISASGNPQYLLGVAKTAKEKDCKIIALTSNPKGLIIKEASVTICPIVGPEAITGSSRMKSGTAQKMVLNMLTSASMIKIGKTYGNYMIDVKATNKKLKKRAIGIVCKLSKVEESVAQKKLEECNWKVKVAALALIKNISREEAIEKLKLSKGVLRLAL